MVSRMAGPLRRLGRAAFQLSVVTRLAEHNIELGKRMPLEMAVRFVKMMRMLLDESAELTRLRAERVRAGGNPAETTDDALARRLLTRREVAAAPAPTVTDYATASSLQLNIAALDSLVRQVEKLPPELERAAIVVALGESPSLDSVVKASKIGRSGSRTVSDLRSIVAKMHHKLDQLDGAVLDVDCTIVLLMDRLHSAAYDICDARAAMASAVQSDHASQKVDGLKKALMRYHAKAAADKEQLGHLLAYSPQAAVKAWSVPTDITAPDALPLRLGSLIFTSRSSWLDGMLVVFSRRARARESLQIMVDDAARVVANLEAVRELQRQRLDALTSPDPDLCAGAVYSGLVPDESLPRPPPIVSDEPQPPSFFCMPALSPAASRRVAAGMASLAAEGLRAVERQLTCARRALAGMLALRAEFSAADAPTEFCSYGKRGPQILRYTSLLLNGELTPEEWSRVSRAPLPASLHMKARRQRRQQQAAAAEAPKAAEAGGGEEDGGGGDAVEESELDAAVEVGEGDEEEEEEDGEDGEDDTSTGPVGVLDDGPALVDADEGRYDHLFAP